MLRMHFEYDEDCGCASCTFTVRDTVNSASRGLTAGRLQACLTCNKLAATRMATSESIGSFQCKQQHRASSAARRLLCAIPTSTQRPSPPGIPMRTFLCMHTLQLGGKARPRATCCLPLPSQQMRYAIDMCQSHDESRSRLASYLRPMIVVEWIRMLKICPASPLREEYAALAVGLVKTWLHILFKCRTVVYKNTFIP